MIREIHGIELSGEQMETIRDMLQSESGQLFIKIVSKIKYDTDELSRKRLNPVEPLDYQFLQRECHNASSQTLQDILDLPELLHEQLPRRK